MLAIHIYSFSYARTGLPPDPWGHGGGFVFDCRLLPNPGRLAECASLTGMHDPVKQYLEAQSAVAPFLASVAQLIETAIAEYQRRGYEHLTVAFGCTGGQHRSVYCAEWMRKRLEDHGCSVTLEHSALTVS
jgi:RNase adaptor protein for sRNA GlmZ degradation